MSIKFIHFEHLKSDTFLCFDKIAYVQRLEDVVFIHFDGDSKPVQLRGKAAEKFLQVVQDNSLTIYVNDSGSESENAIADNPNDENTNLLATH